MTQKYTQAVLRRRFLKFQNLLISDFLANFMFRFGLVFRNPNSGIQFPKCNFKILISGMQFVISEIQFPESQFQNFNFRNQISEIQYAIRFQNSNLQFRFLNFSYWISEITNCISEIEILKLHFVNWIPKIANIRNLNLEIEFPNSNFKR